jgi:hypothetical protein
MQHNILAFEIAQPYLLSVQAFEPEVRSVLPKHGLSWLGRQERVADYHHWE